MATDLPSGFQLIDMPKPQPTQEPQAPTGFTAEKEPDFDPDSFFGRVGQRIGERVEKVERGVEMYEQGEISYPELTLRGIGFGFGSVFDTIGEGVMSILGALTPDEAEDFLKEQIAAGGTALMKTDTAKEVLQFYQELSPRSRDNIGDILTTATGMMPKGQLGKTISKSGLEADKAGLGKVVLNQSDNAKQMRSKELGLPKNLQTTLNREDQILNTVVSLPGVSSASSRKSIMGSINKEMGRLGSEIKKSLAKAENQFVPKQLVNTQVTQALQQFIRSDPIFASPQFKNLRKNVQEAYKQALKEYSGKPQELLKLRQDFDRNIATLLKKDVHEGDVSRQMVASVRNSLNDMMEAIAPDDAIKASMRRQHHLMVAKDNLAYNMAREGSLIKNTMEQISSHPYLTMGVMSGSGVASKVLGSEALGLGLMSGAAAYGITRPAVRRAAGAAMSELPVGRGMLFGAGNAVQDELEGIAP